MTTQTITRISAADIIVTPTLAASKAVVEPYVCPAEHWSPQQRDVFLHELQHLVDSLPDGSNKHDRAIVAINFCIDARVDTASLLRGYLRNVGFHTGHITKLLELDTGDAPEGNHWKRDRAGRYFLHPSEAVGIAVPAKRPLAT
jgi:hypothetical protein